MGYNGFLAGTEHKSIVRWGHEQATIHAEINAITDAAKRGVSIDDAEAYITHYPCLNCFKALASRAAKLSTQKPNPNRFKALPTQIVSKPL